MHEEKDKKRNADEDRDTSNDPATEGVHAKCKLKSGRKTA
jgi:hypothetical protein